MSDSINRWSIHISASDYLPAICYRKIGVLSRKVRIGIYEDIDVSKL